MVWDKDGGAPRHEKAAQQVFFAVADAYREANNLDVAPEASAGNGPVDFKSSAGYSLRIPVKLKKSTNSAVVTGYTHQLEIYKDADETTHAHYIVIDYGRHSALTKRRLSDAHDAAAKTRKGASRIRYVDASPKASASRRQAKAAP
ncbi:MAG: hypothetical protein A3E01_00595 [Gammaproteobacteria bacterium RIFCSPHIGHO2_12_FULL_63_22]|nr:MAG: hypothetical protein A3E01_00595 [Gammaproteobacteria bacterium RIFCSPHIGHO2_12_FULL_63_22]